MSAGKYLSLEEARKQGKLERFAKENEQEDGNERAFDDLLEQMAKSSATTEKT